MKIHEGESAPGVEIARTTCGLRLISTCERNNDRRENEGTFHSCRPRIGIELPAADRFAPAANARRQNAITLRKGAGRSAPSPCWAAGRLVPEATLGIPQKRNVCACFGRGDGSGTRARAIAIWVTGVCIRVDQVVLVLLEEFEGEVAITPDVRRVEIYPKLVLAWDLPYSFDLEFPVVLTRSEWT